MNEISEAMIELWTQYARRDDWHTFLVGSDIRVMLGEIQRLRAALASSPSDALRVAEWWQLVPKEITENMAAAMECEHSTEGQWAAALAASPAPPAPASERDAGLDTDIERLRIVNHRLYEALEYIEATNEKIKDWSEECASRRVTAENKWRELAMENARLLTSPSSAEIQGRVIEECAKVADEAAKLDACSPTDRITRASRAGSIGAAIRALKTDTAD